MSSGKSPESVLNFDEPLDVNLLDLLVYNMYHSSGPERDISKSIIEKFGENPIAWTRVDSILEFSKCEETKFFALHILEKVVRSQWKVLPQEQSIGIREYIISRIWALSEDFRSIEGNKIYLGKLKNLLVQILKHDWPGKWPDFISSMVKESINNLSKFHSTISIIKMFSEELFDFSTGMITQTKAKFLKQQFVQEFPPVFEICLNALGTCDVKPLVVAILSTISKFLSWLPVGYIFETNLLECLLNSKFVQDSDIANNIMACLTEIASIDCNEYIEKMLTVYRTTINLICSILPEDAPFEAVYDNVDSSRREFIEKIALFLSTIMKKLVSFLDSTDPSICSDLYKGHLYLIGISWIHDSEVFKTCLDYWVHFSEHLYYRCENRTSFNLLHSSDLRSDWNTPPYPGYVSLNDILTKVRVLIVSLMPRPREVCVVEAENGEVVRQVMHDTDSINLYSTCRQALVYLTHLDHNDMVRIMISKLDEQIRNPKWTAKVLNSICWAIGSISGTISESEEAKFFVIVVKDLLNFCDRTRGKDNKAIVASNIMYISGQYPRFSRSHTKFLTTVINKLFEFMHELHEGVQDMAVDTFLILAKSCGASMVSIQGDQMYPFIVDIISDIPHHISDLTTDQMKTFYEAIGCIISKEPIAAEKENLIMRALSHPVEIYSNVSNSFSQNPENILNLDVLDGLCRFYKINTAICSTVGQHFEVHISNIYHQMIQIYISLSEAILNLLKNQTAENRGSFTLILRKMSAVKRTTLGLVNSWVSSCSGSREIYSSYLLPVIEPILIDYLSCPPEMKIPEVLQLLVTTCSVFRSLMIPNVSDIINSVFSSTMELINREFTQYPEHRNQIFLLLKQLNTWCFDGLLNLAPEQFKLVVDSIVWSFQHTMHDVAETGLQILIDMLKNYESALMTHAITPLNSSSQLNYFYSTYFVHFLDHILAVTTDITFVSHLHLHAAVIAHSFKMVKQNSIPVPISAEISSPQDNLTFLQSHIWKLLQNAFPHLKENSLNVFIKGLTVLEQNSEVEEHLRDLLIQVRELQGEDTDVFFMMEREKELEKVKEAKIKAMAQIPGMVYESVASNATNTTTNATDTDYMF